MLNWRDPLNPISGGAERVSVAYLQELVRRGHEVCWFANDFPGAAREENFEGVKIVRGGGRGSSVVQAIQWYRRQPKFDLVIDQHHGIPWYAPWWCRTHCVAYIHEVLGPIWNSFYPWPVSTLGRGQERWTHWLYRDVPFFTASAFTREQLLKHGVRNVKIIPYGVHTRALPALEEKPITSPLRLIMVSRLAPNKRVDHGIRTLRCLTDRGIAAQLTIVGTGEETERLKALAAELRLQGKIDFTGLQSEAEKDARLRQAHFLLHTSQREGWGLNVIEANAMGTPAAVYPVAGLIESTLHDQTGIVAEKETPESLATALMAVLQTPAKYHTWRLQAWERSKTFHWDRVLPAAGDWLEAQATGKTSK
jgi:glycosyltransferase involved in cell wall biosynthesis